MISRKKKISKRTSTKKSPKKRKKNPENYNLVFSNDEIKNLSSNQLIQYIEMISDYHLDSVLKNMSVEELLKYIHDLVYQWRWL